MSKGSREREDTTWLYMTVPISRRRRRKLLKAGVPKDSIPERSIMVVLDPNCRRAKRKHGRNLTDIKGPRRRFMTVDGTPFTKEMANG